MYFLYIDESGDDGDYVPASSTIKGGSSRYFTLGGIIVDDTSRQMFIQARNQIVSNYFKHIQLPPDFVLHYFDLREALFPYDKLSKAQRFAFSNEIFDTIINVPCVLLSVTVDLNRHCKKYKKPVNVRAYTLRVMLERFQYFLEDKNDTGEAIYEEFNSVLQKKAEMAVRFLEARPTFPQPTDFRNVAKQVKRGDPVREKMLEFADFFAYAPYVKRASDEKKTMRWDSVKHKYYKMGGHWLVRGFVEIL